MNRQQAQELFTLITTVRHVKEMNCTIGPYYKNDPIAGCLLCEGVRHGLYTMDKGAELDISYGFAPHFGCTLAEGWEVIWHNNIIGCAHETTGENYYQAGKELLIKYGYGDMFGKPEVDEAIATILHFADNRKPKSFPDIMAELKGETVTWEGQDIPVTGVIG